jgi:hypothetical protein
MLKAAIIAFVLCAGAASAAFWLAPGHGSANTSEEASAMPSIAELHAKAHLENLPVQEFRDPF